MITEGEKTALKKIKANAQAVLAWMNGYVTGLEHCYQTERAKEILKIVDMLQQDVVNELDIFVANAID